MSKRALQQQIHIACRDLKIDADDRRAMQEMACGKASMKDMTERDLKLVINHLKSQGWKPQKRRHKHKAAPRRDLRLVHVLWGLLGRDGHLDRPDRAGLNAFIRSQFEGKWSSVPLDVDMLTDPSQINDVIMALRAWCNRAGVELDG